jgi:5'-deoxynucleotidase YfbR-like HD superfamily hydrolase
MDPSHMLVYCLWHDLGELWAGDLPFGAKIRNNGLKEAMEHAESSGLRLLDITLPVLTDMEKAKVKICDLLEMWEFGTYETHLGNEYAAPVVNDTLAAALKVAAEYQLSEPVHKWLRNQGAMK